jgi:drug/metabolite transporter (DMT)-like permease
MTATLSGLGVFLVVRYVEKGSFALALALALFACLLALCVWAVASMMVNRSSTSAGHMLTLVAIGCFIATVGWVVSICVTAIMGTENYIGSLVLGVICLLVRLGFRERSPGGGNCGSGQPQT